MLAPGLPCPELISVVESEHVVFAFNGHLFSVRLNCYGAPVDTTTDLCQYGDRFIGQGEQQIRCAQTKKYLFSFYLHCVEKLINRAMWHSFDNK